MKKIWTCFFIVLFSFFAGNIFAQDAVTESDDSLKPVTSVEVEDDEPAAENEKKKIQLAGISDVPAAKRPKSPDSKKVQAAELKDEGKDYKKETADTIKFGIESEIMDLIKKFTDNEDPRFSNELYDLFQNSKSPVIREQIMDYFINLEDPCLEDYAVTILNDPYEEKSTTVELCFKYVSKVKCKAAVPAVVTLLESENEKYFNAALNCLGDIGGTKEAEYLVDYLDRTDLTAPQRQSLMKVLGKIQAVDTWDKLSEIAQDEDENTFVRMYAAEAIGQMKNPASIPILLKLFESPDPNFREYVVRGISNFNTKEAENLIIQGIRDAHQKVRLVSMEKAQEMGIKDAVPFIIYRAKNDPENSVKNKAYEVLAKFNNGESNSYLVDLIKDEKFADGPKIKVAESLLKYGSAGRREIADITEKIAADDKRKSIRYALGKLIVKYPDSSFAESCKLYLKSKDAATCALGLEMFASGRYPGTDGIVRELAENDKAGNNQKKAKKILKME